MVIYKIQSKINDKIYIGSALNFKRRKKEHLHDLKKRKHHNSHLQNHTNKYGIDDLMFSIIEHVENEVILIEREQYYLDTLNPVFNILKIAGSARGFKHSEETKKKLSKSLKGRISPSKGFKWSEESKVLLSKSKKDTMTDETRNKIRLANIGNKKGLGKKHSDETKRKISNANKGPKLNRRGIKMSKEAIDNMRNSFTEERRIMASVIGKNNKGRKRTEKSRKLMSEKAKLRKGIKRGPYKKRIPV